MKDLQVALVNEIIRKLQRGEFEVLTNENLITSVSIDGYKVWFYKSCVSGLSFVGNNCELLNETELDEDQQLEIVDFMTVKIHNNKNKKKIKSTKK
jgi:hypothetical protein